MKAIPFITILLLVCSLNYFIYQNSLIKSYILKIYILFMT